MDAYRIAYDGRAYRGFQRQPDVPTVEDAILDALEDLDVTDGGPPPAYAAAGRTDAGVSARAQTVAFEAPDWLSPAAFNGHLPADVRAWARADAPPGFHATHDALAREYVYHLYAPVDGDPAHPPCDDGLARRAMARLAGEHDFHNLTPDEEGTVRTLETAVERDGDVLSLRVEAGGFARHMVRRMAALVASVARGDAGMERLDRVLAADPLSGPEAVATAPAHPLVLDAVDYDLSFAVDAGARESARRIFTQRRAEDATRARVAGTVAEGL